MIPFSYELAKAIEKDNLRRAMSGYGASEANAARRSSHRKQKSNKAVLKGRMK